MLWIKNYVNLRGDWTGVWDKLKPSLAWQSIACPIMCVYIYVYIFQIYEANTMQSLGLSAFQINIHYIRTSLAISVISFKHGIY